MPSGDKPRAGLAAIAAIMALTLSCGEPPTDGLTEPSEPDVTTWEIAFENQKSSMYGGSSCTQKPSMYCMTWFDDVAAYSGTLRRIGDRWQLEVPKGTFYHAPGLSTLNGAQALLLQLNPLSSCDTYLLSDLGAMTAASIAGSFHYQTDCHGFGSIGIFTGQR